MDVEFKPHIVETSIGQSAAVEWGRIQVPENHADPASQTIELALVRVRGQGQKNDTPIFYLPGGPGLSILDHLSRVIGMLPDRIDLGDILILEPRGVAHSRPSLDCPGSYDLPLAVPGAYQTSLQAHRRYVSQAAEFWRNQGVDLAGYNARQVAADVDSIRRALRYPHIALMGGSFGSHYALAVIRYFAEMVERAVLWGIEGPDHTKRLPGLVQSKLEALNRYLHNDPKWGILIPDLLELMANVLDDLDRHPVTVELAGTLDEQDRTVTAGQYDLQWITADGIGSTNFQNALPARFLAMMDGDYSWLAAESRRIRRGLQGNQTYELVDCASGASTNRRAGVRAEAPLTLLADVINGTLFGVCDLLGVPDLGDSFRKDLATEVPILLIAGSLDPRTPVENASEVLSGMLNGQLLVVEGASHDLAWRGAHVQALTEIRDSFLAGETVETQTLSAGFQFYSSPIS